MDPFRVAKYAMAIAVVLQTCAGQAFAQQSAYADLDACTKNEQLKLTAKGAAMGALAGLGGALFSGHKEKAGKAAAAGAIGGGVIGFATAYYTAIDTCNKLNPSWVGESKLVRDPSKSYSQVVKENRYVAKDGITLRLREMAMPGQSKPGDRVAIDTVYDLMTPDGAESAVVFSRKLFIVADGTEQLVQFPAAASETRTVEAGRSKESMVLPIAPDSKPGTVYRVEFSAAAGGKAPVTMSKSVTVI